MNIAERVISKCGGVEQTALLARCTKNWVYRWAYPKSDGGTGGLVPRKAQEALLAAARRGECEITPEDFFGNSEGEAA